MGGSECIARYNRGVWPAQIVLCALAVTGVIIFASPGTLEFLRARIQIRERSRRPDDRSDVGDELAGLGGRQVVADDDRLERGLLAQGLEEEPAPTVGLRLARGMQAGGFQEQQVVGIVEELLGAQPAARPEE